MGRSKSDVVSAVVGTGTTYQGSSNDRHSAGGNLWKKKVGNGLELQWRAFHQCAVLMNIRWC